MPAGALPNGTKVADLQGESRLPDRHGVGAGNARRSSSPRRTRARSGSWTGRRLLDTCRASTSTSTPTANVGLLGIALASAVQATTTSSTSIYTNASPLENRVTRFIVENNRCTQPEQHRHGGIAATSGYHNGGQLEFVGRQAVRLDGRGSRSLLKPRTRISRLGKILRYNPNGSVPNDNPFGTSEPRVELRAPQPVRARRTSRGPARSTRDRERSELRRRAEPHPQGSQLRMGQRLPVRTRQGWERTRRARSAVEQTSSCRPIPPGTEGKLKALNGLLMGDYGNGPHPSLRDERHEHATCARDQIVYDGCGRHRRCREGAGRVALLPDDPQRSCGWYGTSTPVDLSQHR